MNKREMTLEGELRMKVKYFGWRKHWFVLQHGKLTCYSSAKESSVKWKAEIDQCIVSADVSSDDVFQITMVQGMSPASNGRPGVNSVSATAAYSIKASSKRDRDQWVSTLQMAAIAVASPSRRQTRPSTTGSSFLSPSDASPNDSEQKSPRALTEETQNELLKDSETLLRYQNIIFDSLRSRSSDTAELASLPDISVSARADARQASVKLLELMLSSKFVDIRFGVAEVFRAVLKAVGEQVCSKAAVFKEGEDNDDDAASRLNGVADEWRAVWDLLPLPLLVQGLVWSLQDGVMLDTSVKEFYAWICDRVGDTVEEMAAATVLYGRPSTGRDPGSRRMTPSASPAALNSKRQWMLDRLRRVGSKSYRNALDSFGATPSSVGGEEAFTPDVRGVSGDVLRSAAEDAVMALSWLHSEVKAAGANCELKIELPEDLATEAKFMVRRHQVVGIGISTRNSKEEQPSEVFERRKRHDSVLAHVQGKDAVSIRSYTALPLEFTLLHFYEVLRLWLSFPQSSLACIAAGCASGSSLPCIISAHTCWSRHLFWCR